MDTRLTIMHYEKLAEAPHDARTLALQGHYELAAIGHSDITCLETDDQILVARLPGNGVAGVIVFFKSTDDPVFWTTLTFINPLYRQRGVYRQLWAALVKIAQESGINKITGGVHKDNVRMQKAMEAVGRKNTFLMYDFIVDTELGTPIHDQESVST